jgi:hypothetical protein
MSRQAVLLSPPPTLANEALRNERFANDMPADHSHTFTWGDRVLLPTLALGHSLPVGTIRNRPHQEIDSRSHDLLLVRMDSGDVAFVPASAAVWLPAAFDREEVAVSAPDTCAASSAVIEAGT